MKKFLTILLLLPCLLVAQSLEGQQIGGKTGLRTNSTIVNVGDNVGLSSPPSKTNYNVRASAFFLYVESLGKTLTSAQKSWYNDSLFVPLYNHGLIGLTRAGDSLVALYSFSLRWAGDSTVANLNLLDPNGAYNCIHYGGVTYTDSGVTGNGSDGYLNTGFNPVADSSIVKNASISMGVCSQSGNSETKVEMGVRGASTNDILILLTFTGRFYGRSFSSGGGVLHSLTKSIAITTRCNTTGVYNYLNNTQSTYSEDMLAKPNQSIYICAYNNNGTVGDLSTKCLSFAFIGSGLSATLSQYLSDDLNNALKGAGYNVY